MVKSKSKLTPPPIHDDMIIDGRGTQAFIRYLLDIQRNTELESGDIEDLEKRVSDNEDDIATNSQNISTNTQNIATNAGEILNRMYWKGAWAVGDYLLNDVVRDGAYTMVANTATSDRPAPQTVGSPEFIYKGTGAVNHIVNATQIVFGTRYILPYALQYSKIRVYTKTENRYLLYIVKDPLGTPIFNQVGDFTAISDGWQEFTVPEEILLAGVAFDAVVVSNKPDDVPTTWVGDWDYSTPNNATNPTSGEIVHADKALDEFRIHKTDDNGGDRGTELEALTIGDIITDGSIRWAIQGITDNTTWMNFIVSPTTQRADGVTSFTFETVTAKDLETAREVDYNLGNSQVRGLFIADGGYTSIVPDDNQYGVDIMFQQMSVSADWELLAVSGGASGASIDLTYDYDKQSGYTDLPDTYTTLNDLIVDRLAGVYVYGISLSWIFDRTNDSVYLRFSTDGGATWNEFIAEPKDKTDTNATFYSFPSEHNGGIIQMKVEIRKDTGGGQLDVPFTDVWIERKK